MPSSRHPLDVRSDTRPDLGGGSKLGAAPIFFRLPPRGSAPRRLPLAPTGYSPGLALHSLPTAWGYTRSPLRPSKARTTLAPRRGTDGPSPATPSAAGCAGAALPRQPRPPPTARAGRGRAPGRRPGGGRSVATGAAPRQKGTPHTSPRAGRGAWWRLPCRPLTGRARPRRLSPEQKRRAAGSQGHTQGAVPTPCGKEVDHACNGHQHPGGAG